MDTRDTLIKLASEAELALPLLNLALKHQPRRLSERAAERILEGFGKNHRPHKYFRVGNAVAGSGAGLGALTAGSTGALIGNMVSPGAASALGGAGALSGGALGAVLGARVGYGALGGTADLIRNSIHQARVKELARNLRTGAGVAAVGAAGAGGLAAYRKHKGKK